MASPEFVMSASGFVSRIAESMRESGEALVKSFGIRKGLKVLDLGCGDGTTALPAARLGADVLHRSRVNKLHFAFHPHWLGHRHFDICEAPLLEKMR
jgi:hypothetical protein